MHACPSRSSRRIITEANSSSSAADACEVVARARDARNDDIKAIAAGFKSAKRKGIGSALHIGGLLRVVAWGLAHLSVGLWQARGKGRIC
ncbi:MAG: hypothetical protein ACLP0J_28720 [Solirubrobacteraceae bacterium]|jgi:hypothetical protein